MGQKFYLAGKGATEIQEFMHSHEGDPGLARPYFNDRGVRCVALRTGKKVPRRNKDGSMVVNARGKPYMMEKIEEVRISDLQDVGLFRTVHNATVLTKDEWRQLDTIPLKVQRSRLKAWNDLENAATVTGFDAFATPIFEYETVSDEGESFVDMDMLNEERNFEPQFQLEGTPLPITHAGWFLSKRFLAITRKRGMPMDTTKAEQAIRRNLEKVEKTLIGTITGITYGNASLYSRAPTVYGYRNFPGRSTKTNMNAPTGANGPTILTDWLALRDLLFQNNEFGPFVAYTSTDYDQYLDNLFSTTEPSAGTLRSRLLQIDGLQRIQRLDYLTNTFTVLLVVLDARVARAIVGQRPVTVQWEEMGGFLIKYRNWCILVPQIREDYIGQSGIAHGTTS